MNLAVIEIGTNSTKMIIVQALEDGKFKLLEKKSEVNRLSQKMYEKNIISEQSMEKGLRIIGSYINEIKSSNAKLVSIISTSVLRDACNGIQFIEKVMKTYGYQIDVISGEREANLAYIACSSHAIDDKEQFAIIDIGGGSTEIIIGSQKGIYQTASIDIGAVRLTEMFVKSDPISQEEIFKIQGFVKGKLEKLYFSVPKNIKLIGTGGTVKTIATMNQKIDFNNEADINGLVIPMNEVQKVFEKISKKSLEERKIIEGLNPKRADVILAGLIILLTVMNVFEIDEITVSSAGVLEGFMQSYLIKKILGGILNG